MSSQFGNRRREERNQEATVWVGGLEPQATDDIIYQLMLQAGPVIDVGVPRDKVTGQHQGYAFVEYATPADADYAIRIMDFVKLYGKNLKVNRASRDTNLENDKVGANLFVGGLDHNLDEKGLEDCFNAFGRVIKCRIMKDEDGQSKGCGFVHYDNFDSSDRAIQMMNRQYLQNRLISVQYAYKDGQMGVRHGDEAERLLAAKKAENVLAKVQQMFPDRAKNAFQAPAPSASASMPPSQQYFPPPIVNSGVHPPPLPHAYGNIQPPPQHFGGQFIPPPPMQMHMPPPMQMQMQQQHYMMPQNMRAVPPPPMMNPTYGYPPPLPPQQMMQPPPMPPQQVMQPPPLPSSAPYINPQRQQFFNQQPPPMM